MWFHKPVAEDRWSVDSTLRVVELEGIALGVANGKPGYKPAAGISQGRLNLRTGQTCSHPLAEPATVCRVQCDLHLSDGIAILWAMSVAPWQGAFPWDEVCSQFWFLPPTAVFGSS